MRLVGKDAITPDKAIYCNGNLSFGFFLKGLKSLFENSYVKNIAEA